MGWAGEPALLSRFSLGPLSLCRAGMPFFVPGLDSRGRSRQERTAHTPLWDHARLRIMLRVGLDVARLAQQIPSPNPRLIPSPFNDARIISGNVSFSDLHDIDVMNGSSRSS